MELLPKPNTKLELAIQDALSPLNRWKSASEDNIEQTRKLLEEKLKNIHINSIVSPEPHIAVPTLQYISYCMDNHELRDMYANLLATSMQENYKDNAHPSYVEIIKQLSPDEAKIMRYIGNMESIAKVYPALSIECRTDKGEGITLISNFSNIGEFCECEFPLKIVSYLENLERLGLITFSQATLVATQKYTPLENHPYIKGYMTKNPNGFGDEYKLSFTRGMLKVTEFGIHFCSVCTTPYVSKNEFTFSWEFGTQSTTGSFFPNSFPTSS